MSGKILVAMSGGVDSSVAALLLKEAGEEVVGVFMRNGIAVERDPGSRRGTCCSLNDAHDARRVADMLGIPFYVLNFEDEFGGIIDYFVAEYNRGMTPNPCIVCNRDLKFGRLFTYAAAVGADRVATGHYAVTEETPRGWVLRKGRDESKDQSYVLFPLARRDLPRIRFPLGGLLKSEVRAAAARAGLPVKNKPESQEICFVPDDNYGNLVRKRSPESIRDGEIVTSGGEVVGKHQGHQFYTIGQRKGIGAHGDPMYVVAIDAAANRVVIGEDAKTFGRGMTVREVNWLIPPFPLSSAPPLPLLSAPGPGARLHCAVRIRHRHAAAEAEVEVVDAGTARVRFAAPQRAITPGQAAVFYDGDVLIGGGWIREVLSEER